VKGGGEKNITISESPDEVEWEERGVLMSEEKGPSNNYRQTGKGKELEIFSGT